MKLKVSVYSILFAVTIFAVSAENDRLVWSKEEGSLDWKSAVEKCKQQGKRLPSTRELLTVKSPESKKWLHNWYWSQDEVDSERAWIVVLNVGHTAHIPKKFHNFVRCID